MDMEFVSDRPIEILPSNQQGVSFSPNRQGTRTPYGAHNYRYPISIPFPEKG